IAGILKLDERQKEMLMRAARSADRTSSPDLGGIVEVHGARLIKTFDKWLGEATQRVRIIETWIGGGPIGMFAKGFPEVIKKQIPVQVLLIDYESASARQRGLDLGLTNEETVPKSVLENLWEFDTLRNELPIEVKLYDNLPSFTLYQCDDRAFVSFFTHGFISDTSPQLEIEGQDTLMGKMIDQEFDELWKIAKWVDWNHPLIEQNRNF